MSGPSILRAPSTEGVGRTLLVVVGASTPYSLAEANDVRSFLEDGGRLLVADNFGYVNTLIGGLGVSFERVRLVDPVGGSNVPASVGGKQLEFEMQKPTSLRADALVSHRIIANSSAGSYLDRDGDGFITAGEPLGPFPVIVHVDVGSRGGAIIAVGDPSVFLAASNVADGNGDLRNALLATLLPSGGRVLVDESREPARDPWLVSASTFSASLSTTPWREASMGIVAFLLVVGILLSAFRHWTHHKQSSDYFVGRAEISARQTASASANTAKDPSVPGRVQWTRKGRFAFFSAVGLAVAGIGVGSMQATYAAAFLFACSALAFLERPPRVEIERRLSTREPREQGAVNVDLRVESPSRRQKHVEIFDPLAREFVLERGHNWFQSWVGHHRVATSAYVINPAVRGTYLMGPVRVRATDPFGLRCVETTVGMQEPLHVHPRKEPVGKTPARSKRQLVTMGAHLVSKSGEGAEFHSLRGCQSGDSIRIVNWKASARSIGLVVNQRVHESTATATIFLDARAIAGAGVVRLSPINEGCRAVLSIADGAVKARDRVRIFAYGNGVQKLAEGGSPEDVHDLSVSLAKLEAGGTTTFAAALDEVLPTIKPRSPVILVSGLEADPTFADAMGRLVERGIVCTALALPIQTGPLTSDEAPADPDSERLLKEREGAVRALQGSGASVYPLTPGLPLSLLFRLGAG
ncbi:MAG TPA: DUF4350 domain-containing protein [Candidatus Thermoplasmatota archaeon]